MEKKQGTMSMHCHLNRPSCTCRNHMERKLRLLLSVYILDCMHNAQLMFANFGETEAKQCMKWLKELRDHNVPSEMYPDSSKLKKQMTYANNKNIPFVALVGENELANNSITVKNMETGDQNNYTIKELVNFFTATKF